MHNSDKTIGPKTRLDDERRLKKMKVLYKEWMEQKNGREMDESELDLDTFLAKAEIKIVDDFLAHFIKIGPLVKDRLSEKERLPTGASFNTFISATKRIMNTIYMRNIGKG